VLLEALGHALSADRQILGRPQWALVQRLRFDRSRQGRYADRPSMTSEVRLHTILDMVSRTMP
jgi:hypothetical protein